MARPTGSKVIVCDCGGKIVAMVGEAGVCKHCKAKVRFTKKLMRELGKTVN